MKQLKGTKTEANLMSAFAGESMAYVRYLMYASKAKKEGYVGISNIFAETAGNEFEHAEVWFKRLHDGVADTATNLRDAAGGENFEWRDMYPEYAQVAREEGFEDLAVMFERIGAIEAHHEARYLALLKAVEQKTVFRRPEAVDWQCMKCGNVHHGTTPPDKCPVCNHDQGYFEVKPSL